MSVVVVGRVAASVVLCATLLAGCARFDESTSSPYTPEPTVHGAEIEPSEPNQPFESPSRPTGPCADPDPAVAATCLETTGGLVAAGGNVLVAERRTGRILTIVQGQQVMVVAELDVDGSADGGLSDIAVSPTYREDGLLYAYITTATDNRVVRLADDGPPKAILTGIPKGPSGNRGAIDFVSPDTMLVLTGDAGNPDAAASTESLAGKLLRVDSPVPGRAAPPEVAVSGIGTAGDVCVGGKDRIWITDRSGAQDRLRRVAGDGTIDTAWTWPDRPGVAGCAATTNGVAISLTHAKALAFVVADQKTHAVTTAPTLRAQDEYGQLGGATADAEGGIWVATVNKTDGSPGPFDDRVVYFQNSPDAAEES
ncbi:PQQ-dependent sugar dehydrogenase [Nocardia sp. CNY236]|uniref:PQQ-dependent sugar dehydrogenase n=1 Tax=Nocardia sp. CNY236 TaxID=1169152 RepID=UPI0003FBCBB5|nr:PQQ-dependent sugar dehydrogenase [Nocardia sp. CNY236]